MKESLTEINSGPGGILVGGSASRLESWHGTRGGYTHHKCRCSECRAADRAYTDANRDRINAKQRLRYRDPAVRARDLLRVKAWASVNPYRSTEARRLYQRQWFHDHPEKRRAYARKWRLAHLDRAKASARARQRGRRIADLRSLREQLGMAV